MKKYFLIFLSLLYSLISYGSLNTGSQKQITDFPWAVMGYWGRMTNNDLLPVLAFQYDLNPETLYSGEVSYQLAADNPLRLFFQPKLKLFLSKENFY